MRYGFSALALVVCLLAAITLWLLPRHGTEVRDPLTIGQTDAPAPRMEPGAAIDQQSSIQPPNREVVVLSLPEQPVVQGAPVEQGRTVRYIDEYVAERTDPKKIFAARLELETKFFLPVRQSAARRGDDPNAVERALSELKPVLDDYHDKKVSIDLEMAEICRGRLTNGNFSESDRVQHGHDPQAAYLTFPSDRLDHYRTFAFTRQDSPRVFAAFDAWSTIVSKLQRELNRVDQQLAASKGSGR